MNKKTILLVSLSAMMAIACNKDNIKPAATRTVAIDPVITKATETDFEEGDKIGVTITRGDEVYTANECMTHDGSKFTSTLFWYTEGELNSKFVAYYPYSESVPTTFAVAADQNGDAYSTSDLMGASKDEVVPQASVTMVFKHLLTRIVVNIDNQVGATISSATLSGSKLSSSVDFDQMKVTVDSEAEAADIAMHSMTANTTYAAIVIPQEVKFTLTLVVDGGRTITKSLSKVTLKPGGQYSINAVVVAGDLSVSMSGEIQNWNDEGVIPEKEITFEEFDDYFMYDDERYNTVVLADGNKWMAQNMRFIPSGKKVSDNPVDRTSGIWYPYTVSEGVCTAAKDAASITADGYLYSYDVILGAKITDENHGNFEGVQGICPPGWHVPTRAEYFALCGNSNRSAYLDEPNGTKTNPDAYYFDATYSAAKVAKFNDAGFNFPLCGGISLSKYSNLMIDSSVCSVESYYGKKRMTYIATSSPSSAIGGSSLQMFALMTTFTSVNNEGKVSLAAATVDKVGIVLRCVKTKTTE